MPELFWRVPSDPADPTAALQVEDCYPVPAKSAVVMEGSGYGKRLPAQFQTFHTYMPAIREAARTSELPTMKRHRKYDVAPVSPHTVRSDQHLIATFPEFHLRRQLWGFLDGDGRSHRSSLLRVSNRGVFSRIKTLRLGAQTLDAEISLRPPRDPALQLGVLLPWEMTGNGGTSTVSDLILREADVLAEDADLDGEGVRAQILEFFQPYLEADPELCTATIWPTEVFLQENEVGVARVTIEFSRPGAVAFAFNATDPDNDEGSFTSDVMVLVHDDVGMFSILFEGAAPALLASDLGVSGTLG